MNIIWRIALCALLCIPQLIFAAETAGNEHRTAAEQPAAAFEGMLYTVTLAASYGPARLDTINIAQAFPSLVIYQAVVVAADSKLFFVRVGFFATREEAEVAKRKIRTWYPDAWVVKVTEREQAKALGVDLEGPSKSAAAKRALLPAPTPIEQYFSIRLATSSNKQFPATVIPPALVKYRLYVVKIAESGKTEYQLSLGVFDRKEDADAARVLMSAAFPQAAVSKIATAEKKQVAALPEKPVTSPAVKPKLSEIQQPTQAETFLRAKTLVDKGLDLLAARDYAQAYRSFDEVLTLPNSQFTAVALEYLGVVRDRAGEIERAKYQYELYLRVYPDGEAAPRIRQRLAALNAPIPEAPPEKQAPPQSKIFGGLSQFYNRGASQNDTTVPSGTQLPTLISTNQSSLYSTLDLSASFATERFENRFVLHDQNTHSFLTDVPSDNWLSAAFLETRDKKLGYLVRLGRQSLNSLGVFGLFDGGLFTYNLSPQWRANVVIGEPRDYNVYADRSFYSVSLDAGPIASSWWGNAYFFQQKVEGYIDRQAVGAELRFQEPKHSIYSLFDYDTSYSVLNVGVVQVNWQTDSDTTFTLLADHRQLPLLQTTNAVYGNLVNSFTEYLQLYNDDIEAIRTIALARTATSINYDLGIYQQVTKTWQLGGDVRRYSISETQTIDPIPGVPGTGNVGYPGTGNIYVYTLQARATGLLSPNDLTIFGVSHKSSDTVNGNALSFTNRSIFAQDWTLDTRLRVSKERTTEEAMDTEILLISPAVRLSYRISKNLAFETEVGAEISDINDLLSQQQTSSRLKYFSLGYRWNF
jgi:hypothetical protein